MNMLEVFNQMVMKLYRGRRERLLGEYQKWAFDQLQSAFHFDSGLWLTGVLNGEFQATAHTVHVYNLPRQVGRDWANVASKSRAALTERVFCSPGVTTRSI